MPVSNIESPCALVVIDMQRGIVSLPTVHPASDVVSNVERLTSAFRHRSRPIVIVTVGPSPDGADMLRTRVQNAPAPRAFSPEFAEPIPELHADPARDIFIRKRQWGAFYGTELDLQLRRRRITDLVFCGIATSIGVESSARDAWERGYNLTFASDAMTDLHLDAHDRALSVIFPRIGEVGTTDDILSKL